MGSVRKKPEDDAPTDYFRQQKFILRLVGIPVETDLPISYWATKLPIILAIWLYTAVLHQISLVFVFKDFNDPDELLNNLLYESAFVTGMTKGVILYFKRHAIAKVMQSLEKGIFLPNKDRGGQHALEEIRSCYNFTNKQTKMLWVVLIPAMVVGVCNDLYTRLKYSGTPEAWHFPVGEFRVFNARYSPMYEIISAYQTLAGIYFVLVYVSIDLLLAGIMLHISCQYRILQHYIRTIVQNSYQDMMKDKGEYVETGHTAIDATQIPWTYFQSSIKAAVEYHTAIKKLTNDVEDAINELVLAVFITSICITCLVLYQASLMDGITDWYMIVFYFGGYALATFQILAICYWGDKVSQDSMGVALAAFEAYSSETDVRLQKCLLLIMQNSQQPVQFTIGKFGVLSLDTFVGISQASYSYFNILRNLKAIQERG